MEGNGGGNGPVPEGAGVSNKTKKTRPAEAREWWDDPHSRGQRVPDDHEGRRTPSPRAELDNDVHEELCRQGDEHHQSVPREAHTKFTQTMYIHKVQYLIDSSTRGCCTGRPLLLTPLHPPHTTGP